MTGLLAVLVLVLLNGFFVATEFAIVAVRRTKLEQLVDQGKRGAAAARDVVTHLDLYIAACQFGITVASLGLGWVGEPTLAHFIEPAVKKIAGSFAGEASHVVGVAVSFTVITGMHIVIGELAPKGLALQRTENTVLFVARPMRAFYFVFRWPIRALNAVGNGVLKIFGLHPTSESEMVHSVDEVKYLLAGMRQVGEVEESEARIASRAFDFADQDAASLMTPRPDVIAMDINTSAGEVVSRFAASGHTRLPVYRGSLDDVVGVVHIHDVLKASSNDSFDLAPLVRPASVVPESVAADRLLEQLRSERRQIAVVVDEHGGTAGVVTLEDLFEALVGRIDEEVPLGSPSAKQELAIKRAPDGSMRVEGRVLLTELDEIEDLDIDDHTREQVDTIGGAAMALLNRIPTEGDEIKLTNHSLRVISMDGRRVAEVEIQPHPLLVEIKPTQ